MSLPAAAAAAAATGAAVALAAGGVPALAQPARPPAGPHDVALLSYESATTPGRATHPAAPGAPSSYVVRPGDTLSLIAQRLGIPDWADLWWWNRAQVPDPDVIRAGQVLTVWRWRVPYASWPAYVDAQALAAMPKPKPPPPVQVVSAQSGEHEPDGDADDGTVPAADPASAPVAQASGSLGGPWPGGAFGNCVVERESGGNPNVMNSTGHYGLYQFSFSTWVAYGGSPGSFGNASVGEQEQVFLNAMSQPGGADNWAPYDGC